MIVDVSDTIDQERPQTGRRMFRRAGEDRYVAGVAAGIAHALEVDPLYVRIAIAVGIALAPLWAVAYAVLWLIVPTEGSDRSVLRSYREPAARRTIFAAVALGIGAIALAPDLGRGGSSGLQIGLVLVAAGIALLARGAREDSGEPPAPRPPTAEVAATAVAPAPAEPRPRWLGARRALRSPRVRTPRAPRPRPFLAPIGLSVVVLVIGIAAALDQTDDSSVSPGAVTSICMLVVGATLVLSAWWGRARGLVLVGIALLPFWIGFSLVNIPRFDGSGDRTYRPLSRADLEPSYTLGFGSLRLDLGELPLERGERVAVDVGVTAGRAVVEVPADAVLLLTGRAGLGDVQVWDDGYQWGYRYRMDDTGAIADYGLDRRYDALSPMCSLVEEFAPQAETPTTRYLDGFGQPCAPQPPVRNPATIELDVRLGIGRLEVHRVPPSA